MELKPIHIENGQVEQVKTVAQVESRELLMREEDRFSMDVLAPESLPAPVEAGEMVGTVIYYLNGEVFDLFPVCIEDSCPVIDYEWCLKQVTDRWLPGKGITVL